MKVQLTNRKFWNFHAILYVEQTDRWKGNGKMKGITGFFYFLNSPLVTIPMALDLKCIVYGMAVFRDYKMK